MIRLKADPEIAAEMPAPELEPARGRPRNDPPPSDFEWFDMADAPRNRSLYVTPGLADDPYGTLVYWRLTRIRPQRGRAWEIKSFWASQITKREIAFVPAFWREAAGAMAVAAMREAEQMEREAAERQQARLAVQAEAQREAVG